MDLAAVKTRLTQLMSADLHTIEGAAAFAAVLEAQSFNAPSAYLVPLAEQGEPSQTYNPVMQRRGMQFGVIWVVQNLYDAQGEAAQTELVAIRDQGFASLIGWEPDGNHEPVQFVRGDLMDFNNQFLLWQDVFATATYLRG